MNKRMKRFQESDVISKKSITWKSCFSMISLANIVRRAAQTYRWKIANPSGSDYRVKKDERNQYKQTFFSNSIYYSYYDSSWFFIINNYVWKLSNLYQYHQRKKIKKKSNKNK